MQQSLRELEPGSRALRWLYGFAMLGLGCVFVLTLWETLTGNGPILWFIERYLSGDQSVGIPLKRFAQLLLISGSLFLILWFCAQQYPTFSSLPRAKPRLLYLGVAILCVAFVIDRHGIYKLPTYLFEDEDMLLETMTWILFLVAMFFVLATAVVARRRQEPAGFFVGALVIAAGLFVLGMEEISWGQRIIGWDSPEYFATHNDQQETNVHNFFNDYIWLAYQLFATAVAVVIILSQLDGFGRWLQRTWSGLEQLLPHPTMFYFAPLFVLIANYNELFEEVFSVFAAVYALRLWHRTTRPSVPEGGRLGGQVFLFSRQ